jgi:uncharacterized cofD-like protein
VAPRVVAVGGGHGLAVTLRAVRRYAGRITAVVSTADDGGSSGRLRRAMTMPAPGDLRRCLVALAGAEDDLLGRAFEYRFAGTDVEGHALGNLLLAALTKVTGDFVTASEEAARLLGLDPERARVVPAATEPVELQAVTVDGKLVAGQVEVSGTSGIERIALDPPDVQAPEDVVSEIHRADQVVLGPGDLYTSVLAAAVVENVAAALAATEAQRVYVCNLRAEVAETQGYDVARHVGGLRAHGIEPDVVLVQAGGKLALGDLAEAADVTVVKTDLARPHGMAHDSDKLAAALAALVPSP